MNKALDRIINIPSTFKTDLEFVNWFDNVSSVEQSIKQGVIDFSHRIFTPDMYDIIGNPQQLTACEIGFGAGRLLIAASYFFNHVIGIDIHTAFSKVEELLNSYNRHNFSLHHQNDLQKFKNSSIDFFYSFIVFQHFVEWETALNYLKFIKRTLTKDGVAIIFFGENRENNDDILIKEYTDADVNTMPVTMTVSQKYIIEQLNSLNFEVINVGVTKKKPWLKVPSMQFYVRFKHRHNICNIDTEFNNWITS